MQDYQIGKPYDNTQVIDSTPFPENILLLYGTADDLDNINLSKLRRQKLYWHQHLSLGQYKPYCWLVCLLPKASKIKLSLFNGMNGYSPFQTYIQDKVIGKGHFKLYASYVYTDIQPFIRVSSI